MSLKEGIIPQDWKQSHITPVHIGGNFDDPSNNSLFLLSLWWPRFWRRLYLINCHYIWKIINCCILFKVPIGTVKVVKIFY